MATITFNGKTENLKGNASTITITDRIQGVKICLKGHPKSIEEQIIINKVYNLMNFHSVHFEFTGTCTVTYILN
ncbi:MAG TPA: hypothetical protein VN026_08485 [Bacteroidia bacterium]|jgi:hypothetical protein|nr:hypothetical protein [Bacteroidia bacterium]